MVLRITLARSFELFKIIYCSIFHTSYYITLRFDPHAQGRPSHPFCIPHYFRHAAYRARLNGHILWGCVARGQCVSIPAFADILLNRPTCHRSDLFDFLRLTLYIVTLGSRIFHTYFSAGANGPCITHFIIACSPINETPLDGFCLP